MALIYSKGKGGIARDLAKAAVLFELAGAQGHANSLDLLGLMYLEGEGVPRNDRMAAELFSQSAREGNMYAANNLGVLHLEGRDTATPVDDARALQFLRIASAAGHSGAAHAVFQLWQP